MRFQLPATSSPIKRPPLPNSLLIVIIFFIKITPFNRKSDSISTCIIMNIFVYIVAYLHKKTSIFHNFFCLYAPLIFYIHTIAKEYILKISVEIFFNLHALSKKVASAIYFYKHHLNSHHNSYHFPIIYRQFNHFICFSLLFLLFFVRLNV